MAKGLELTWVEKLRQWRKRRNVGGKRKDFYLGTGNGPDDRESYRRALGKWKLIEAELDAEGGRWSATTSSVPGGSRFDLIVTRIVDALTRKRSDDPLWIAPTR